MNNTEKFFMGLLGIFVTVIVIGLFSALYFEITDNIDSRKPNYTRIGYFNDRAMVLDLDRMKNAIIEVKSVILK